MKDKIEQVKNIKKIVDDVFLQKITESRSWDIAERLYNALYSEPQVVCPKPEQMMICPSYPEQDKSLCSQCHHFHEHVFEKGTCDRHLTYCKGCIPVPSTPAKPEIKIKVCKGVVDNKEHIITVPVPSTPGRDCWQEKSGVAKLQKGDSPE